MRLGFAEIRSQDLAQAPAQVEKGFEPILVSAYSKSNAGFSAGGHCGSSQYSSFTGEPSP